MMVPMSLNGQTGFEYSLNIGAGSSGASSFGVIGNTSSSQNTFIVQKDPKIKKSSTITIAPKAYHKIVIFVMGGLSYDEYQLIKTYFKVNYIYIYIQYHLILLIFI